MAVYRPVLRGGFVWDDLLLVEQNPLVKGQFTPGNIWFQTDFPLSTLCFWVQWKLWGNASAGYHAVNLCLHALNAVLIARILGRLRIPGAWLAALLFAAHPMSVASAAWISELKNTLSVFLTLLSLEWFLRSDGLRPGWKRGVVYGVSLSCFALALLAKTSVVMLPIVLLACGWWQRGRLTSMDGLRTAPFFLLSLGFGLMTIWFQAHQTMRSPLAVTEPFPGRLAAAGWAVWFYLGKALLPVNLCAIYPRWDLPDATVSAFLPLAALLGLFLVCARVGGWGRATLLGLGFFVVNLVPVLGLFDMYYLAISRVSDHFVYLALAGVLSLFAAGLHTAMSRWLPPKRAHAAFLLAGGLVVAGLAALSLARARVYATDEALWRDTLAKNPKAWIAHNNLGCILAEQRNLEAAVDHFRASIRLNPANAKAQVNLGRALLQQGKLPESIHHLKIAIDSAPGDAEAHRLLATALIDSGQTREALLQLYQAVLIDPRPDTRLEYAERMAQTGQARAALAQFEILLAHQPESVPALSALAWVLATAPDPRVRDGAKAVVLAEKAWRLAPEKEARLAGIMGAAYAETGRFDEAVAAAEQAIKLATASGDGSIAAANRQMLRLYQQRKPYHSP